MITVISVENLSKTYRLGQIGTSIFAYDLNLWWAKMRGRPNPMLRIGDHDNRNGEEIWAVKIGNQAKIGAGVVVIDLDRT